MCEHANIRDLCREFFELGIKVGRDDMFREDRLAAAALPDNVYSFQQFRSAKVAPATRMENDA